MVAEDSGNRGVQSSRNLIRNRRPADGQASEVALYFNTAEWYIRPFWDHTSISRFAHDDILSRVCNYPKDNGKIVQALPLTSGLSSPPGPSRPS